MLIPELEKIRVTYKFHPLCQNASKGETERQLENRINEHRKNIETAISNHIHSNSLWKYNLAQNLIQEFKTKGIIKSQFTQSIHPRIRWDKLGPYPKKISIVFATHCYRDESILKRLFIGFGPKHLNTHIDY